MKNVVLIGMPAVGKTTVGRLLAKKLNMQFVDGDDLIRSSCMAALPEIIEKHGRDGFVKIENAVLAGFEGENTVLATGGSAVYGEQAMEHLKSRAVVIYLYISYDRIALRLRRAKERGVALRDGQTLRDLYDERAVLYEKYADITINEADKKLDETVEECLAALKSKL